MENQAPGVSMKIIYYECFMNGFSLTEVNPISNDSVNVPTIVTLNIFKCLT